MGGKGWAMFRLIPVLSPDSLAELRQIAASAEFVDGRLTNPHSGVKNNLQLQAGAAYERSGEILRAALLESEEFRNFAFPKAIAPPMLTRYTAGMNYGAHADAALMFLPRGVIRADLSCTIFLSDPETYDGGALRITLGAAEFAFKAEAGVAIVYPSTTLHEVDPVTRGERLVGLTFIQSRIADPERRTLLFELNEVAALEGLNMEPANRTRLQAVQSNLMRRWVDAP
jgi:PKHD-type hydroxylase